MLPSNLLLARRRSGKIMPIWLTPSETTLSFLSEIQQAFVNSVGKKKTDLDESLYKIEEDSEFDYRQVRGITTILERRCVYSQDTTIDPQLARRTVFHESAISQIPITQEERLAILTRAANQLGVTVKELETSLYADLKEESRVKSFEPLNLHELISKYNLEITQTLLFNCINLLFHGTLNWKIIFGLIKWLGLMYDIEEQHDGYLVTVDGPFSLLRASRRYGTRLAMLLPHIVSADRWEIQATIMDWRDPRSQREFDFAINSSKHGPILKYSKTSPIETYDSSIEKRFAQEFKSAKTGWSISREPRPLKAGTHVMIPDFLFERTGEKIYMEIVGFWTTEYITRKIRKLQDLSDVEMIVAADKSLACEELDSLPENIHVIYYQRAVPIGPIIHYLRARESELLKDHHQRLERDGLEIQLEGSFIPITDIALRMGILESALKKFLQEKPVKGYVLVDDILISKQALHDIEDVLRERTKRGPLTLAEANKILGDRGIKHPASVLEHLGYHIDWASLDPEDQRVS